MSKSTLTYKIIDTDGGESHGDKRIKVEMYDGENKLVGWWGIYIYFKDGVSNGLRGSERRIYYQADLADEIFIEEDYRGQQHARFMGKILAEKMATSGLKKDDILWISAEASQGFWAKMGMTPFEKEQPPQVTGVTGEGDDKWMTVGDFFKWTNKQTLEGGKKKYIKKRRKRRKSRRTSKRKKNKKRTRRKKIT